MCLDDSDTYKRVKICIDLRRFQQRVKKCLYKTNNAISVSNTVTLWHVIKIVLKCIFRWWRRDALTLRFYCTVSTARHGFWRHRSVRDTGFGGWRCNNSLAVREAGAVRTVRSGTEHFSGKWCGDDERRARAGHWHVSWALGSGESETALPVALSVKTALFCLLPASYANGATALLGTHLEELQCKSHSPAKFPCVERAFVWCNHIILSQKS